MRALVLAEYGQLEIREVPTPEPGPGEVCVQISATGICGSDVHGFLGHQKRRRPGLVLGHESVGVIVEAGMGVDEALFGTRVSVNPLLTCGICRACRSGRQNCCETWQLLGLDERQGGFAEFVCVPDKNTLQLRPEVSDAHAVMVEPLANAYHLLSMVPREWSVQPTAAVLGAGTLGSCIYAVMEASGFDVRFVSEPNPARRLVAETLGAAAIINPHDEDPVELARDDSNGYGLDVVVDAVGTNVTRSQAVNMVRRGGVAIFLGMDAGPSSLDFQDLVRREVRIQCTFAYAEKDYLVALQAVNEARFDFTEWTDIWSLDRAQEAFDTLIHRPEGRLKIALRP